MLKITGAVLILASCAGMGFGKGMEYKRRVAELLLLKKWLLMLRGEIKYAGTPLPEAFARIGSKMENVYGIFLTQVSKDLEGQNGQSLQEIWEKNLNEVFQNSKNFLNREDRQQLKSLGSQLGYLDREMQISTIDFFVEQMETQIQQLEAEQGKRCRVYHCIGIFAGVMLNLLLL